MSCSSVSALTASRHWRPVAARAPCVSTYRIRVTLRFAPSLVDLMLALTWSTSARIRTSTRLRSDSFLLESAQFSAYCLRTKSRTRSLLAGSARKRTSRREAMAWRCRLTHSLCRSRQASQRRCWTLLVTPRNLLSGACGSWMSPLPVQPRSPRTAGRVDSGSGNSAFLERVRSRRRRHRQRRRANGLRERGRQPQEGADEPNRRKKRRPRIASLHPSSTARIDDATNDVDLAMWPQL
jgi:hypothetical protein